ncbi:universal stress family protein [Bordetella pertussis]|uniref:Universal stress family protein n=10 Tax=Bordetella TaxID=517 RepID=Q7VYK8_BORPE|nr:MULTISPECIES: universal stress protein [Bordetella]ETH42378.1 universal stress family protein [Bordetella pertussis H939]ETH48159.1 universal stress family protein [Bordetella pertussis H921]ETH70937.1 universal stress family protein [Bordetella pertussis STO1-CHLA-0011]ETH84421.1 universal stress family protein [Bordetella pertussis STO1-CHOC-0017]ETH85902.1 universal stress family protein [Bordetella pertussis STO1-CHOC-0018]ETH89424.1 universal stress family protein [Bordetella pertussi
MLKILVPVDGSECAVRAVREAIKVANDSKGAQLHLLNVQLPLISGHAKMFLRHNELQSYYQAEGEAALATVLPVVAESGIPFESEMRTGQYGETIANYAKEKQCDRIVMGTRGLGAVGGLLLGSVARKVIHLADVPITLVK